MDKTEKTYQRLIKNNSQRFLALIKQSTKQSLGLEDGNPCTIYFNKKDLSHKINFLHEVSKVFLIPEKRKWVTIVRPCKLNGEDFDAFTSIQEI